MQVSNRKRHSSGFKAQVALEAIRNQSTIAEISSEKGVHPSQVNKWKKQALNGLPGIFSGNDDNGKQASEKLQAELYQQIGRLKVELDWLKKNSDGKRMIQIMLALGCLRLSICPTTVSGIQVACV
jgi:putative transposase